MEWYEVLILVIGLVGGAARLYFGISNHQAAARAKKRARSGGEAAASRRGQHAESATQR